MEICSTATGEPKPKYSWWFSKTVSSNFSVMENENGPTLVITDAKEKDHQGYYQCHVTNDFGSNNSDPLNIKVGEFHVQVLYSLMTQNAPSSLTYFTLIFY